MEAMSTSSYDHGWETKWDDMKKYGPFSRHIRRVLKRIIGPLRFDSVLDVGCGQGSLLEELRLEFPQIKPNGIDISKAAVELARKRVPDGRFWALDIARIALEEKFDLVICSEVLEHIPDDKAVLKNLIKMVNKYLVISSPQGFMRRFEQDVGHVRNYAPGELVQKLKNAGFNIITVVEWGFPFYSPLYRNLLEFLGGKGTGGTFGGGRKVISFLLYYLFLLNSSKRGDEIFVLAEPSSNG
jgi:SAM-dependent methyltransferase